MKIKFVILLVIMGNLAFGQTEKHKQVPGTKCSMIPPEGFIVAANFSGFQNAEKGASIMVTEIPGPFQEVTAGFTAEGLKTKGMTLIDKQTIDFNNSKALFAKVSQPGNGTIYLKNILVFGDANHTVMVNGIYPEASKAIEPGIKASLLSTSYNAGQSNNPLDAVKFTIDMSGTDFKLITGMTGAGSIIYNIDGKIPSQSPSFIAGNALAKVQTENQKQYAQNRLKNLPGGDAKVIKETNDISINDLKGYEIIADGKDKNGNNELTYQVMLFADNGEYYIMVGNTTTDPKSYLETFRKIARTFKRK